MELPPATQRFVAACAEIGYSAKPLVFPEGTKTSKDAARVAGCELRQISKSIVLSADGSPILVLMSGDLRIDTEKLARAIDAQKVGRADVEDARAATGYAVGGTPPFGHATAIPVYADVSLKRSEEVWVAAGTPTTIFPMPLNELVSVSGATWVDVGE
jgi:Cys-tRNA(Pro) deacylase